MAVFYCRAGNMPIPRSDVSLNYWHSQESQQTQCPGPNSSALVPCASSLQAGTARCASWRPCQASTWYLICCLHVFVALVEVVGIHLNITLLSNESNIHIFSFFFYTPSIYNTTTQTKFVKPVTFRETAKLVEEPGELTGRAAVYGMAQKIPQ